MPTGGRWGRSGPHSGLPWRAAGILARSSFASHSTATGEVLEVLVQRHRDKRAALRRAGRQRDRAPADAQGRNPSGGELSLAAASRGPAQRPGWLARSSRLAVPPIVLPRVTAAVSAANRALSRGAAKSRKARSFTGRSRPP
jgi:hypothetical protein